LGICLPNSFSSAWMMFRGGVLCRRGYSTDGRGLFLTERVPWSERTVVHRADAYLALLPKSVASVPRARDFWGIDPENPLDPRIPGVLESFDAQSAWGAAAQEAPPQESYWILAPGSAAMSRRWPLAYFEGLARLITEATGWTGVVIGGRAEKAAAQTLCSSLGSSLVDWTERGSVASLWKVFRSAKFTVGNDSGICHVAALCGSPVQVIGGAGNLQRTEPLGPGRVRLTLNPVECWPCERNECGQLPLKQIQCLTGIFPDRVWKEIQTGGLGLTL
jgi:heptosyltransferase-2